jgi:hypothetical protein
VLKQAKWFYLSLSLVLGGSLAVRAAESVRPLPNAHAHNDYLHPRPLLDALAQGFCSVEADIYLVEGRLLVAHEAKEIRPDRTLEALYLDPLQQRAREHGGRIYRGGPPLVLLVDIKGDADATYAVLRETLARYSKLFTRFEQGKTAPGAVTVILSGNRPRRVLEQEPLRYAAMDGRLEDLGTGADPALIPLVSTNWQLSFNWRGVDAFPAAEREKLRDYVRKAHDQHYRLRFWATPDTPAAWRELRDAGVDLINTDDLAGLAAFLRDGKS